MAGTSAPSQIGVDMTLSVSISSNLDQFALEVDFQAEAGVTAIFGASGAGKTTIINAVAGIHKPDRGRISLGGKLFFDAEERVNLPVAHRQSGYVFQDHRLFPHLNVARNLDFARKARRLPDNSVLRAQVLDMLGLEALLSRYPIDLSGGEKQRVAIGRALLSEPNILLLDEPLASLDQARRLEILPYLERLRDHTDLPILYVSHSVSEVARLANQVLLIDRGQQRQFGSVTDVLSNPEIARFVGVAEAGAVLFADVLGIHADGVTELQTSGGRLFVSQKSANTAGKVRVRIQAKDVMLSLGKPEGISALNSLPCEVSGIQENAERGVLVRLKCGSDFILASITQRSRKHLDLKVGMPIFAILKTVSMTQSDIGYNNI